MCSYYDVELCELIGIYTQFLLERTLEKDQMGLYRNDELIIFHNINSQQTEKEEKNIIRIFKSIDFKIDIKTKLTEFNFLDVTFNLERKTYQL